jgi:hypothetical protein
MGHKQSALTGTTKVRAAKPVRAKVVARSSQADVAMGATFMLPFEADNGPPWLVEDKASEPTAKPKRKAAAKKVKPKAKTPKPATAKKPKATVAKPARKPKAKTPLNDNQPIAAEPVLVAPLSVAPLPRAHAPVVWQKTGPLDAISYWLRINSKALLARLRGNGKAAAKRSAMALPKRRSRQELLLELAVLREENAMMRAKLGLPSSPFGRQIVDKL